MLFKNKMFAMTAKTKEDRQIPLWVLKDTVSSGFNYFSDLSTEQEVVIQADVSMISITVIDYPVLIKAKTDGTSSSLSSSNATKVLGVGQHDFQLEENITHIDLLELESGSRASVSQFKF